VFPAKESLCAHARAKVGRTHPVLLFILVTLVFSLGPSIALAQQLNLTWTDNSGGQAGFVIQRGPGTSGPFTNIAQLPLGVATYKDTAVTYGTMYCYQVAAVSSAGVSAFSNLACGSASGGGFSVTTAKVGTGAGTVSGSPAGISCDPTCSYTYYAGTVVTLAATPSTGSTFSGWSGGGCSGTDPCGLAGNGSVTVTATFDSSPTSTPSPSSSSAYSLTVTKQGPGTVYSSPAEIKCGSACSATYASGTGVTLTAVPAKGARFGGWSGGGCSGTGTCTVTINTATSVSATFSKGGKK
jgi:Divergent InlB B-repeat domain